MLGRPGQAGSEASDAGRGRGQRGSSAPPRLRHRRVRRGFPGGVRERFAPWPDVCASCQEPQARNIPVDPYLPWASGSLYRRNYGDPGSGTSCFKIRARPSGLRKREPTSDLTERRLRAGQGGATAEAAA